MTIYSIIQSLAATPSRLEKEAILKTNQHNIDLKTFFKLALDAQTAFYIKKIPEYTKNVDLIGVFDLREAMQSLSALSTRKYTGHSGIEYLKGILESVTAEDAIVISMIIGKDPKCGCSTSTVNKIWKDLVTDVPYMRCSLSKHVKLTDFPWKDGVYSQIKADGMYINLDLPYEGNVQISSRNGSPFPLECFSEIIAYAEQHLTRGSQYHGELIMFENNVMMSRKRGNGRFNSILSGEEPDIAFRPVFYVWDTIPIAEAVAKGKFKVPYKKRFGSLVDALIPEKQILPPIELIESKLVHSFEEAKEHYRSALSRKLEGTVYKHPDMPWADGTSKRQIKMKLEVEVDLEIVSLNPADPGSKNASTFGSMLLKSSCGLLECSATGFDDKERADLWEIRDSLPGKITTVKANDVMISDNPKKLHSLFLPNVVEIRKDKKTADSYAQILDIFASAIE